MNCHWIANLFEEQARRTPRQIAVVAGDARLSYGELNARANQWAHGLVERGVGPNVLVAIHAERSIQRVIATLAVLKAGGAYVPLEPGYPPDRLAHVLAEIAAPVVLS